VPPLTAGQTGYDVLAHSRTPISQQLYTLYVYIRSRCDDPGAELACMSQLDQTYTANAVAKDVAPGDYFIFHDATSFSGSIGAPFPNTYELSADLRPVLASGQPCDPAGVANRCHGDACAAGGNAPACP